MQHLRKSAAIKSIAVTTILFISAISLVFAASLKSSLKKAEAMIGDYSKIADARSEISKVLSDSTMSHNAKPHFVAGKIELAAYNNSYKKLSINQNDPSVNRIEMDKALMQAYRHFSNALRLDRLPDKRGNIKPRYSTQINEWLKNYYPNFFNAGTDFFKAQQFYPDAYDAFNIFALLVSEFNPADDVKTKVDSIKGEALFYAGISAYKGNKFPIAYESFESSKKLGRQREDLYINQIACMQKMAADSSIDADSATYIITDISKNALQKFGLDNPVFINKYVSGCLLLSKPEEALSVVDNELREHNDNKLLHNLRADILIRQNRYEDAEKELRLCAEYPEAEFSTLISASKVLIFNGAEKQKQIKRLKKKDKISLQETYFLPAKEYLKRAKALNPTDPIIKELEETVNYYLL